MIATTPTSPLRELLAATSEPPESRPPKPQGSVVVAPFRWGRAWILLGPHHLQFLNRETERLGYRSPSPTVQRLIDEAMDCERERDRAGEVSAARAGATTAQTLRDPEGATAIVHDRRLGVPEPSKAVTGVVENCGMTGATLRESPPLAAGTTPTNLDLPRAFRWNREWFVLGSYHLEFLTREAQRLGYRSPSPVVAGLIEEALDREREQTTAVVRYSARADRMLSCSTSR